MRESALTKAMMFGLRYGMENAQLRKWKKEFQPKTQKQRTTQYIANKRGWKKALKLKVFDFFEAERRVCHQITVERTEHGGRMTCHGPSFQNIPKNSIILVKHP